MWEKQSLWTFTADYYSLETLYMQNKQQTVILCRQAESSRNMKYCLYCRFQSYCKKMQKNVSWAVYVGRNTFEKISKVSKG